jgi:flagellar assembly protein FliH
MSSSTDSLVVPAPWTRPAAEVTDVRMPELSRDTWVRLDRDDVADDEVSDLLLDRLAGTARASARAQGYAVGWAEGRRDAEAAAREEAETTAREAAAREEQRAAEHAAAVAALHEAARALRAEVAGTCRRVDEQASALALELVAELVGTVDADTTELLARVTGQLPVHAVCTVRLHPDVAAAAEGLRDLGVTVVGDRALSRADAVVEADDHVVDLRVAEALDRLREVLA